LSLDEIEEIRKRLVDGASIYINSDVFNKAEEAYSAVKSNRGPKVIQSLANISYPIMVIILITMLAMVFI